MNRCILIGSLLALPAAILLPHGSVRELPPNTLVLSEFAKQHGLPFDGTGHVDMRDTVVAAFASIAGTRTEIVIDGDIYLGAGR